MIKPIDITDIFKQMQESGFTPTTLLENFAQVEPMPASVFEAAHHLMRFRCGVVDDCIS